MGDGNTKEVRVAYGLIPGPKNKPRFKKEVWFMLDPFKLAEGRLLKEDKINEGKWATNKNTQELLDRINQDLGYKAFQMRSDDDISDTSFKLSWRRNSDTIPIGIGWGNTWEDNIFQINVHKNHLDQIANILEPYKEIEVSIW